MAFETNMYEQPVQSQIYNTYVPIPFEELLQAGLAKQAKYDYQGALGDQLLSNADQQQGLSGVQDPWNPTKVLPLQDASKVNDRINYYNEQVEKLASEIPDKGNPMYVRKLQKIRNEYQKDMSPQGVFGIAKHNIDTYNELSKLIQDNPQSSDNPWLLNPLAKHYRQISGSDSMQPLQSGFTIGDEVNRQELTKKYLDGIGEDLVTAYAEANNGYVREGWRSEVSEDKILSAFLGNNYSSKKYKDKDGKIIEVQGYLETGDLNKLGGALAGSPIIKDIKEEAEKMVINGEIKPEEYNRYIYDEIVDLSEYAVNEFRSSDGRASLSGDSSYNAKRQYEAPGGTAPIERNIDTSSASDAYTDMRNLLNNQWNKLFDDKGKLVREFTEEQHISESGFEQFKTAAAMDIGGGQLTRDSFKMINFIAKIKTKHPELKDFSDQQALTKWSEYAIGLVNKANMNYSMTSQETAESVKNVFFSNLGSADVEVDGKKTTGDPGGKNNFYDVVDYTPDEFKTIISDKNLLPSYDFISGKFSIQIPNKKGDGVQTVRFDGDNREKVVLQEMEKINKVWNSSSSNGTFILDPMIGSKVRISGKRDISGKNKSTRKIEMYDPGYDQWITVSDESKNYGDINFLNQRIADDLQSYRYYQYNPYKK